MKRIHIVLMAGMAGCAFAQPGPAAEAAKFKEAILYAFGGSPDGNSPHAGVINVRGTLYGTTYEGGTNDGGTLFSFDPATGVENVLYSFSKENGLPTDAPLDVNGTLYGTVEGIDGLGGLVFSYDLDTGVENTVYQFCSQQNCTDGEQPQSGLIRVKGKLYSTTYGGGLYGGGTVFSIDLKSGAETVLHSFGNGADGLWAQSGLIDVSGTLYGTTSAGGANACGDNGFGCGTVFSIDMKTGAEAVLHSFGAGKDGAAPFGVLMDINGMLYGTTSAGGTSGNGTVFSINSLTGAEKVLYSFQGGTDGSTPVGGLKEVKGALYGSSIFGGGGGCENDMGCGTVFSFDRKTGVETVIHSFASGADGEFPNSLTDLGSTLYGTTAVGGDSYRYGAVFALERR